MNAYFVVRVCRITALLVAVAVMVGFAPVVAGTAEARSAGNVEDIAKDIFNRLNDERRARGVAPVAWDGDLARLATNWSGRMSDTKDYRHSDMDAALRTSPYKERFDYIGENIYQLYPHYESAGYAHRGWMKSDGHRRNMLNQYHDAVGIGIICDADGTMWATLNMGRFKGSSRPSYQDSVPANPIVHDNDGGPRCRDYNRASKPLAPGEFRDVNGGAHAEAIKQVALKGVTKGCARELFCPDQQVTRAQMAAFIVRARNLPASNRNTFTDIAGSPHAAAINALAAAGVTEGCGSNRFCPNAPVSRAQMASFIDRAWELPHRAISLRDRFDDISSSSHRESINALADAKITNGCGNRLYCPPNTVKRAEMASFLARAMGLV